MGTDKLASENKRPRAICIGFTESLFKMIRPSLEHFEKIEKPYDQQLLESPLDGRITVILCAYPPSEFPVIEVGQSLRMLYPEISIYFVTEKREGFDRKDFQKNGFTEAFFLPNDLSILSSTFEREASLATGGEVKAFRPVQLVDITPGEVLGFDLYLHLPANNRRIRYVSAVESLGDERAKKLQKHKHQSILVPETDMPKFYQFTARQLKNLSKGESMSETEKSEKREKVVRDLLTGFFTDSGKGDNISHGREMMDNCQQIIKAFVVDGSDGGTSWYERLMNLSSNSSTTYNHAANTSTIAALLAIATGIGDPKEVALAGLLHDIGLASVPAEICMKDPKDRSPEEEKQYQQHPLHSVQLLKERKLIVSDQVVAMIEQHHERFDGKGYPTQMPGPRILKEAQLLNIASEVDNLMTVKEGRPRITIVEALENICNQGISNPGLSAFDPGLLRKLRSIFTEKTKKHQEAV